MNRGKIITITSVIVIIIILLGVMLAFDINPFSKSKEDESNSYFNKTMDIKEVVSGNLVNGISSKGTITTMNTVDVKAPADLKIKQMKVLYGSQVQKGDAIATIDDESLLEEYAKIQRAVTTGKIELGRMKPTYDYINVVATESGKVIESNVEKGEETAELLSENENILVIETQTGKLTYASNLPAGKVHKIYKKSRKNSKVKAGDVLFVIKGLNTGFNDKIKEINELEQQLASIKALILDPTIKADVTGIVGDILVGNDILCQKDEVLLNIKQTDSFLIEIAITKEELVKISKDKEVLVTLSSGKSINGEIYHINYNANDNEKFDIYIRLEDIKDINPNDILPGLSASVKITLEEKINVLKVPIDAMKTDDGGEYVLVYTGEKEDFSSYNINTIPTEKRYIKKGMVTSMYVEVISGVAQGENIVVIIIDKNNNSNFSSSIIGFG